MSSECKVKLQSLKEIKRLGKKGKQLEMRDCVIEDIYEKSANSKLVTKLKTGLVFDEKFTKHECIWDSQYPESPARYTAILKRFKEYDLINRCKKVPTRHATREEICLVHDSKQIHLLESTSKMNLDELESLASRYDSVYFNQDTHMVSHLAVGSILNLVTEVVTNKVQNGMAVIRPPGHHAMKEIYCGYCLYNNVAIAAQYALDTLKVKRILIVDWDVHHGQAIQQTFYSNSRVLYFSIHRYEHGEFWPNLRESNFDYAGTDAGNGYNINVPLNETGCGDVDYLTIFHSLLLPIAYEFEPDLVLVSAGYDAAIGCTEGEMNISPGCYHHLTTSLMGLASGKVVVCLEGGYFLPSLAESAAQTLKALLGDPAPRLENLGIQKQSVLTSIYNVISVIRPKWQCLNYFNIQFENNDNNKEVHKVEVIYNGCELKSPFPTRYCYPTHNISEIVFFRDKIERLQNCYYNTQRLNKVGYVYDEVMELHQSSSAHTLEKPERLTRTLNILKELNLLDRLDLIKTRASTIEELKTCHDSEYVKKVECSGPQSEASLKKLHGWITVFTNADSMKSACMAAGSLMELVQAVHEEKISSGVALIRPPGHHAEQDAASGFCFFNNVALAAKYALNLQPNSRILIIDWDIHHGNGIQRMFYEDPRVLYLSLHRYDNGRFFPHSTDGACNTTGAGAGDGFTINVPWNEGNISDADYISAWTRLVLPVAYQFNPDLIIVAAGFDACRGDPLGGCQVTPEAYGHFVQLLKPVAGGRILLALEGGYNINSVGYSMAMCIKALLNDPLPNLVRCGNVRQSAIQSINDAIHMHQDRWSLLLKKVQLA